MDNRWQRPFNGFALSLIGMMELTTGKNRDPNFPNPLIVTEKLKEGHRVRRTEFLST